MPSFPTNDASGALQGKAGEWVQARADAALAASTEFFHTELQGYAPVEDVPELGEGFGVLGSDGQAVLILGPEGKLSPDLGAATVQEVADSEAAIGYGDPDGNIIWLLNSDGSLHPEVVDKLKEVLYPPAEAGSLQVPTPTFNLPTAGTMTSLSVGILNQANKYLLNTWIPATYPGTDTVTFFGGTGEMQIRTPASAAFGIACGTASGAHDEVVTGHTVAEAEGEVRRLVAGLAAKHLANGGDWGGPRDTPPSNNGSGSGWQSALWAYYMGAAGWLIWGRLSDSEKANVLSVIRWEADRMLRWRLPFWKNPDNSTNYAGDSKGEEISWDAAVVSLAAVMLPSDPHATAWNAKLVEMGYASHAAPVDIPSTETVNGFSGADVLAGYNINADGTVINHDRIHPDYMVSAGGSHWGFLFAYGATRQDAPKVLQHNAAKIYAALSTLDFDEATYAAPGGTIYIPGSGEFYYPEGNDWGTHRVMDKALMDVLAWRNGWDAGLPTAAYNWALLHLQRQADLQARGTDGRTYQAPEEDTFHAREQWVSANAGLAVLNLAAPPTQFSSAATTIITSRNRSV